MTQIAKKEKADYLLTAHHGDDLLENILLKFIRSGNPEEMNSLQAVGVMHGVSYLGHFWLIASKNCLSMIEKWH